MRLREIANPQIHRLYHLWQDRQLPDGRPMPREALDPIELGTLLPNVMLLEVEEVRQGRQLPVVRFRVAG
ncbi:MAG TPA: hypothetical protein VK035_10185, partial [Kiloniellales bacterium]|nr:hypothetical protein [Kiloniellales bacterium]